MYMDKTGHMPKWAQLLVSLLGVTGNVVASVLTCGVFGAVAATLSDTYQIASQKVYIDMENTNSQNVRIYNSYKILTPWMRYVYSFYLNHFNPNTKHLIKGSTVGVQFEWALHNYAVWFGIGGENAKHLDVGKSIL